MSDFSTKPESSQARIQSISYGDLLTYAKDHPNEVGIKVTSWPSYATTLRNFMRSCGDQESSLAASTLLDKKEFEQRLATFRGSASEKSRLQKWSMILQKMAFSGLEEKSFAEEFRRLMDESKVSPEDIAKKIGKSIITVKTWLKGTKTPGSPDDVYKIENLLGASRGTLVSLVQHDRFKHNYNHVPKELWPEEWKKGYVAHRRAVMNFLPDNALSMPKEEFHRHFREAVQRVKDGEHLPKWRRKQRQRVTKIYHLKAHQWPQELLKEWEGLEKYMTAPSSLGNRERSSQWRPGTTANLKFRIASTYFGYLALSPNDDPEMNGMGMPHEQLSLALLAIPDLIKRLIDFLAVRSGGYNEFSITFLAFPASLVRPNSGYLWRNPQLADRLPEHLRIEVERAGGWQQHCEAAAEEFDKLRRWLRQSDKVEQTRDTFEPILPILSHPRPRDLVLAAIDEYVRDVLLHWTPAPGETPTALQAVRWRNLLLLSLLIRWPLRLSHWGKMTYYPHKNGYLHRRDDGVLRLAIPYEDFKNSRSKKRFVKGRKEIVLDFDQFLPFSEISQLAEIYVTRFHPVLVGDMGGPLFPTQNGTPLLDDSVGTLIRTWSTEYISEYSQKPTRIKGCKTFRAHAFRHIVGTDSVKNATAADGGFLLVDDPLQVTSTYARFIPEDGLERAFNNPAIFRPRDHRNDPLNLGAL